MAVGVGRKFIFRGAYDRKEDAKKKERSKACHKKCFILKRRIRGSERFVVLERKGRKRRR